MAAGTSTIRFLSAGPSGRVKKQLNDLYLNMSFKIHKELANFGVISVRAEGPTTAFSGAPRANGLAQAANDASALKYIATNPASETAKDWEANVTLWKATTPAPAAPFAAVKQVGQPMLDQVNGERVLIVVDSPIAGDVAWDATLQIGAIRKGDDTLTVTVGVNPYAYVIQAGDTLESIAASLAALIATDPNATAVAEQKVIVITARLGGTTPALAASKSPVGATETATASGVALAAGAAVTYQNYGFILTKGCGIGQALTFVDDAGQICDDIIALDFNALQAGLISDGAGTLTATVPALQGAGRGVSIKVISVPHLDADWIYHAFVRQINPNIPKDYKEVADHFDGAADTIRAIAIPSLGIQKVFENVPGSFMNLRTRRVTMRADVRENNRFDASEVHYFLGVKGTPTIQFNNDNESIASMECIMYKWITLS
jgi:hypothetical protein